MCCAITDYECISWKVSWRLSGRNFNSVPEPPHSSRPGAVFAWIGCPMFGSRGAPIIVAVPDWKLNSHLIPKCLTFRLGE
jgi:hypothetical protein